MPIERFMWTEHAIYRCRGRFLSRDDLEMAIRGGHEERRPNHGEADWVTHGLTADGRRFAVAYNHPWCDDCRTVLVVSAWELSAER